MNASAEKRLEPYPPPEGAGNDKSFGCVFECADALMYENKKVLKGARI